jgi:chromosome segregation ATPase
VKRLIIRLLSLLGLVTVRRHNMIAAQLRDAESRARKFSKLLEEGRTETRESKLKADQALKDALKNAKTIDVELSRQVQRSEKLKLEGDKLRTELKRSHESFVKRSADLDSLQNRLTEAERELTVAREHLMAVEVKLDILEGAANVLDVRTRAVVVQQVGEPGVPA